MSEHVPRQPVTMDDIHAAFREYAATRSLTHHEEILSAGPPAWVATGFTNTYRAEALRLELTDEPEAVFASERKKVDVLQALVGRGARIVEYLEEPKIIERPRGLTFVGTTSHYLPGEDGTPYEYGQANATMHNASTRIDLRGVDRLDQLAKAQGAYDYFAMNEQVGYPVVAGNIRFDEGWLLAAGNRLETAHQAQRDMHALAEAKKRPLVIVQEDTHNEQYRRDRRGVVRSFDIDATKSVPEVDAGRAETQWENRFHSPQGYAAQYLGGHAALALAEVRFDPEIQRHANIVSLTRFSFAMLGLGVRRLEREQAGADWFLQEGAHRVSVIDDPSAPWHGLDGAMKRKLGL